MAQLLSSAKRAPADLIAAPISAFESETQAVMLATAPVSERLILQVLAGMIAITLVLMSVIKLDRVVNAEGRVLPSQGSFFVQPLDRAIITGILVHPGDVVQKGQVLATLDPTFAQADLKQLQQKRDSLQALVDRLRAEETGQPYKPDPANPYSALQSAIYQQRRAEYAQSVNDFDARIRSAQSIIARGRSDSNEYRQRLDIARQAEESHLELQRQGFGSKLSMLGATDTRVEAERLMSEAQNTAAGAEHDMASLAAQRAVFVGKWRDDAATQLVNAQNDLNETTQNLSKASKVSDLSKLLSPAEAVVLKIGKASLGSVIEPGVAQGDPLFTLTPVGGPLEAEVRVDARDIGFIRAGDPVRIKLDAYKFTQHGTAKGVIKSISDGSFTTTDDGQVVPAYYKVHVLITEAKLRNVPATFRLIPGLTIQGEVIVGRRTIMSYLLEGALRTGSEAMREPG